MMRFTIVGTTYSGDPLRTTLGNTLRMVFYLLFATQNLPKDVFRFFVSGDDNTGKVKSEWMPDFEDNFWRVFSRVEFGVHGLGQCIKCIEKGDGSFVSFLSRTITPFDGCQMTRNIGRVFG